MRLIRKFPKPSLKLGRKSAKPSLKRAKKSRKGSSINIHALGYRLLGDFPARIFPLSKKTRESLLKANIRINHVVYVSSMLFWVVVAFVLPLPISFFIISTLVSLLRLQFPGWFPLFLSLIISLVSGGVTFVLFLYYPIYKASALKRLIEKNLVYSANYMTILSSAGATTEDTFNSLRRVGQVFGLRDSASSIVKHVELLGEDTIAALDGESRRTPSKEYADFLQGYIATIQSGGNVQNYLMTMAKKFMDSRRRLLNKMIGQLGLAGELFVAALVALPIIMVTMLSIMGFFGGEVMGGLSAPQLMAMMVYVLIPFTAVGVLVFIDAVMASW